MRCRACTVQLTVRTDEEADLVRRQTLGDPALEPHADRAYLLLLIFNVMTIGGGPLKTEMAPHGPQRYRPHRTFLAPVTGRPAF